MTALTTAQLDELERQAKAALTSMTEAACRGVALSPDDVDRALSADVTLRLVAIARAALAWNEALHPALRGETTGTTGALLAAIRGEP